MLNFTLASRLGRPDLAGMPVDPYGGTSGIVQAGINAGGSIGSLSAAVEGRLVAGVLTVLLVGYVGFYVWTRNIQS